MNPNTGELRRLADDEKMPAGFEEVRGDFFRRMAEQELRGRESAVVNLQSKHPLTNWAKKKRRAKIAAASCLMNRK